MHNYYMQDLTNYILQIVGEQWLKENNIELSSATRLKDLCFDDVDCAILQYYLGRGSTVDAEMSLHELSLHYRDLDSSARSPNK